MASEGTDHYVVLGLTPTATPTQIKAAYRKHAKAAHPDAGGSAEAMERVNEAYRILGDPAARRAYDGQPNAAHEVPASPGQSQAQPYEPVYDHQREAEYEAALKEAERIDRERAVWARQSAWEMARLSAPVAIVVILAMYYVPGHLPTLSSRIAAGLLTFIPVYMLMLSIIFLINPELRLIFADLIRRHHTTKHERISALAIVLAFFPLAAIWVLLFSH